jgi:GGDEF domain-containing protein
MKNAKLAKIKSEKISRALSVMFNRASMYNMDHPFTKQSINEVYETITDSLNDLSPIALIFNRDRFYIEEELFDPRLHTKKMESHFKKAGIESISFEKGVRKAELADFVNIFTDLKTYPNAASMKSALPGKMVSNLKINHVLYKKVTADDEVVSKEKLDDLNKSSQDSDSAKMYGDVVNMMAESILAEEVQKSISLEAIVSNPGKVSKDIIDQDLLMVQNDQVEAPSAGFHIADQLVQFKNEVQKVSEDTDNLNLSEFADAVFDLKKQLLEGIHAQKALGIYYENETQIIDEADALGDRAIIQLARDEYKKGAISVQRFALILKRLIPEPNELRRLLPQLSEAMLEEGMSEADFFQLIEELGKELQNDDLVSFVKEGAKDIGISSEELINEFKNDPTGAAELIYLASEIRKGTGDNTILTDLLVEYIERLGSKIVIQDASPQDKENDNHLKDVIANVESEIVSKLENKGIEPDVLQTVQQKLTERMEACFKNLKADWESRPDSSTVEKESGNETILKMLEDSAEEDEELQRIFKQIRLSINEHDIDENNFQQLYGEIQRLRQLQEESEAQSQSEKKTSLPNGILSYNHTKLFIEKEVSRCLRYQIPFSIMTISIDKIIPKQEIPKGCIDGHRINKYLTDELLNILRDADLVGILAKKIIAVLLPMTDNSNAKIAMSRILKGLNSKDFTINDISLSVKFAGNVTSFDVDETPDSASFIHTAEKEHNDFLIRLRNVQDLY